MSAPQTNLDKQEKQHRGPLRGMALVVVFALLLLGGFMLWTSSSSDGIEGADTQTDARTGQSVEAETGEAVPATDAPATAAPAATGN
ncbi:hypothetical protein SAMN04488003_101420 [Loktanella fryxellensis]|uniref:Uncharacterized protein n=1 Tax=Loktanella fryxellensis TaxID=245187 RepID=A0A1H7Z1U3_9RHOB|nr:hypothetical protein [Loktanella fryxellensis]SEM52552.1 hypothetical protein SAMN04488003_101420 [Loktanella fryxellensis]